jgi:hypothetical protein
VRFPPGRGHYIFQGAYRDWLVRAEDPQTGSGTFGEPASACTNKGGPPFPRDHARAREIADRRSGGKHLVDLEALRHFAGVSGFPLPGRYLYLPDFDELVAADLLWRYGWSASVAGLAFDDWKTEHQSEMLEVMKQISAISGTPTPQEARNGGGSGVQ